MRFLLPVVLATALLAGCSDAPAKKAPEDVVDFAGLEAEATATTGVIRGVVVDAGIRPIAEVNITLTGAAPTSTLSNENGAFVFSGLEPGTHFLSASKAGFFPVQTSVEVVAGVEEPPVLKVLLALNLATLPRAVLEKWDGFLECGLSVVALCGAAGEISNDNFAHVMEIEKPPFFIQSEAVWTTTTSASDQLWLWHSNGNDDDGSFNGTRNAYAWRQGPSPLLMTSNQTESEDSDYGTSNDLYLRMFTGSIEGTRNPTDPEGCYPGGPGPDVYCGGVGYSLNQAFSVYTTVFYDFLPPEGWTFVETGVVPEPQ